MAWSKPEWYEPMGKAPAKPKSNVKRNIRLYGLLAGLVVVCAVIVGWLLFVPSAETTVIKDKPVVKPKVAKPAKPVVKRKPKPEKTVEKPAVKPSPEKPKEDFVKAPGKMQLPDGRVLTFPPPKEGEVRIVHSHGKMYKCDHLGNWEDVTPKPVFDNAFEENLIGMTTEHGSFIPGMLMGMDPKEVLAMLNKQITINPDDSEDVVKKKEDVARLKEGILEYIKQGGTFDEFVMEMRKSTVRERKAKSEAMRDIVQLLKEDRVQEAAFYRKALNSQLEKDGCTPLKLPAHLTGILDQVKDVPDPQSQGAASGKTEEESAATDVSGVN